MSISRVRSYSNLRMSPGCFNHLVLFLFNNRTIHDNMAVQTLAALAVVFFLTRAIYRLWLSPLAHVPGPKIAGKMVNMRSRPTANLFKQP